MIENDKIEKKVFEIKAYFNWMESRFLSCRSISIKTNSVEPRLPDIRLTDLPDFPTYHTEPSDPRYSTKIGLHG